LRPGAAPRVTSTTAGPRAVASLGLALLLAAAPGRVLPAVLDTLNAIRAQGCAGKSGIQVLLTVDAGLERVALELSRGAKLREALTRASYRAQHSTSLVVTNASSEASLRRILIDEFCTDILATTLTKAGVVQQDQNVWIVLAAPFVTPAPDKSAAVRARVLELVNEARSHKRRCGMKVYRPAEPVRLVASLNRAALRHAEDMAQHSFMGHTGRDGSSPGKRAISAGYSWRVVGENVASGSTTPEQAVADWLESPGHCATLMSGNFTDMGVAFAVNPASTAGIYWSQVFASPK